MLINIKTATVGASLTIASNHFLTVSPPLSIGAALHSPIEVSLCFYFVHANLKAMANLLATFHSFWLSVGIIRSKPSVFKAKAVTVVMFRVHVSRALAVSVIALYSAELKLCEMVKRTGSIS